MFKLKTSVLALAVLTSVAAVPAQAAPVASAVSVVSFENFVISWAGLARQVDAATDFSSLSVTSSQLTAANMTGLPGVSSNPSSSTGADLTAVSTRGTVDPAINSSTGIITASQVFNVPSLPLIGNFSHSVSNETGSPIANFPNAVTPVTANADLHNASYASLDTLAGTAGTSSSSQLASTQFFTSLVGGDNLVFSFDVGSYVGAFLDLGAAQTASAGWDITFTLLDTTAGTVALVATFGDSISNNNPGSGITEVGGGNSTLTGGLVDVAPVVPLVSDPIIAGNRYQLTATISTRTQVERVAQTPEPGALALVGLSLAALGWTRRRKNQA